MPNLCESCCLSVASMHHNSCSLTLFIYQCPCHGNGAALLLYFTDSGHLLFPAFTFLQDFHNLNQSSFSFQHTFTYDRPQSPQEVESDHRRKPCYIQSTGRIIQPNPYGHEFGKFKMITSQIVVGVSIDDIGLNQQSSSSLQSIPSHDQHNHHHHHHRHTQNHYHRIADSSISFPYQPFHIITPSTNPACARRHASLFDWYYHTTAGITPNEDLWIILVLLHPSHPSHSLPSSPS